MENIVTEVTRVIGVFDGTNTAGDIGLKKSLGPYSPVDHLKKVKVRLSYSSRIGQIPEARVVTACGHVDRARRECEACQDQLKSK